MSTGLKFKNSTVNVGGLNIQPTKSKLQAAGDVTVLKPATLGISKQADIEITNSSNDILQLNSINTLRAKIISEKGVNIFRPEIIAATRFEPIYEGEVENRLSDTGVMLETQVSARNVRVDNINRFIDAIMQDADISTMIMQLQTEYSNQLTYARDDTKFAIDVYMLIDSILRRLDIYTDRKQIRALITQSLGSDAKIYDIKELFIDHLGFSNSGFRYFTNTKIFGQLAYDLGTAVRRFTPGLFNIIDDDRPNDSDPIKFDRTITSGKFSFDIANFGRKDVVLNAFETAVFNKFVESLPTASIDRFKLLSVTLSRLMGISVALGTTYIQADLGKMNARLSEDDPIAAAIGVPGQTILDNDFINSKAFIALTQVVDDATNEIALPFEKRYIVNKHDNRYTPGTDYFFDGLMKNENKFDISRLADFNAALKSRTKSMMNVVEAATRAPAPYANTLFGDRNDDLRGETIFNNVCAATAYTLTFIDLNDHNSRNFIFILSIFALSQTDKKLRHLLFQLFALTIVFNDLKQVNITPIEIMKLITANDVLYYGNFPALHDYTALVPIATIQNAEQDENSNTPNNQPLAEETNIGLTRITATNVVSAAYKQVQKLVLDRVFSILLSKSPAVTAQNVLNDQQLAIAINNLGQGSAVINYVRPKDDQTFDDDFRAVMFSIARFADGVEEAASRGGDSVGLRSNKHLADDKSGRSRYLSTSASTRLMYSFELMASMLGTYGFSQFGGFNLNNSSVRIVYNKTKIKSFSKAAMASFTPLMPMIVSQFNQSIGSNNAFIHAANLTNQQLIGTFQKVNNGNVNTTLYNDYIAELNGVRNALKLDLDVITSMSQTFRKIASRFDSTIDNARSYFDDYTRRHSKTYNDFATTAIANKSPRFVDARETNLREIQARRTLISKEQAALSLIRLQDIAEYNNRFSPHQFLREIVENNDEVDQPKNIFIDDTRVTNSIYSGMLSLFAEPNFRNNLGNTTKIVTIGIPAGFNDKLEDSDRLEENDIILQEADRQLDIIVANVYKKDIIEEDIVFKPLRFTFELSRFISQFSFEGLDDTSTPVPFEKVLRNNVRSIDFSSLSELGIRGQLGEDFFVDTRYDFMSLRRKQEMFKNHVVSFLLSTYIRMLTGVDLREDSFLVEPNATVIQQSTLSTDVFHKISERIVELSSIDMTLAQLRVKFPEFDTLLKSIELGEFSPGILEEQQIFDRLQLTRGNIIVSSELTDLARLSSSKSMLTGGEKLRRAITSPKLFERIFHIPVDPYSFEIDIDKTMLTRAGRSAYSRLVKQRRLIVTQQSTKLKRSKRGTDIMAEQYFVMLERYEALNKQHLMINKLNSLKQMKDK